MKSLDIYFVNHAKYHGNMHDNKCIYTLTYTVRICTLRSFCYSVFYVDIITLRIHIKLNKWHVITILVHASEIHSHVDKEVCLWHLPSIYETDFSVGKQNTYSRTNYNRSFRVKSYFVAVCLNIWFVMGTGMWYVIFLVCQHAQK